MWSAKENKTHYKHNMMVLKHNGYGLTALCLKKVPTFTLSVTLSNVNRFSKFCTVWKHIKFATKPIRHYPPHLMHVATLPWEIKNQIFCKYSGHVEENANKLHYKCTDFNSCTHLNVYSECIYVFYQNLGWLLTNTAVTSAVRIFRCTNWSQK